MGVDGGGFVAGLRASRPLFFATFLGGAMVSEKEEERVRGDQGWA